MIKGAHLPHVEMRAFHLVKEQKKGHGVKYLAGCRAFRGSESPVGTSPKAKATRNVHASLAVGDLRAYLSKKVGRPAYMVFSTATREWPPLHWV